MKNTLSALIAILILASQAFCVATPVHFVAIELKGISTHEAKELIAPFGIDALNVMNKGQVLTNGNRNGFINPILMIIKRGASRTGQTDEAAVAIAKYGTRYEETVAVYKAGDRLYHETMNRASKIKLDHALNIGSLESAFLAVRDFFDGRP